MKCTTITTYGRGHQPGHARVDAVIRPFVRERALAARPAGGPSLLLVAPQGDARVGTRVNPVFGWQMATTTPLSTRHFGTAT